MQPTRFGTVRPKQAEILTAKLTAILSDIGAHQRPSADPSCCVFILRGHRWTLADARTAVFKTVGSAKALARVFCMRWALALVGRSTVGRGTADSRAVACST